MPDEFQVMEEARVVAQQTHALEVLTGVPSAVAPRAFRRGGNRFPAAAEGGGARAGEGPMVPGQRALARRGRDVAPLCA